MSCLRRDGVNSSPSYHWQSVLCIMLIAGGGRRLRESGVVIEERGVVCDKGCKVGVVVYDKDGGRVEYEVR